MSATTEIPNPNAGALELPEVLVGIKLLAEQAGYITEAFRSSESPHDPSLRISLMSGTFKIPFVTLYCYVPKIGRKPERKDVAFVCSGMLTEEGMVTAMCWIGTTLASYFAPNGSRA